MKIKIGEMTDREFKKIKKEAKYKSLSDFAKFCLELKGFGFIHRTRRDRIYKYELFALGYETHKLINDEYPEIKRFVRDEYDLFDESLNEKKHFVK